MPTGERQVNAIGYCLGGTLLASALAWLEAKKENRIHSATFFVSMIDFTEPGELGVFIDEEQLKALVKELKNACGAGGTLKEGTLEIQGDHRAVVQARLEHNGLTVKRVGRP